jgi:hypothetical protein
LTHGIAIGYRWCPRMKAVGCGVGQISPMAVFGGRIGGDLFLSGRGQPPPFVIGPRSLGTRTESSESTLRLLWNRLKR